MKITRTTAIILAGGIGVRMKTMTPKQFLRISGKPVLVHTLAHFVNNEAISDIVVVCPKEYLDDVKEIIGEYKIGKVRKIVCGGRTRQESSFNGLKACPRGTEYVLMHDAVR
ncbi:MAG TPA: 2-C-methyl-D-erythritol 4-phosphate cytidylyltransferase, partial [Candidatus Omnitrophota bacterium]|nr:2-C-methyl-D-erythritol 4-phosphate cytidylyltransferase [Candidatus Omnitrophota bacterium]